MDYKLPSLISKYPSQMDIVFTEKCNQNCDYYWVNKSSPHILDFNSIKRGVDIFLTLPIKEQTITFTVTEPFVIPNLYQRTINYILKQAQVEESKKEINIVTTTNGINLNKEIRDFIVKKKEIYEKFYLNISLDGKQKSHDAHRKLKYFEEKSAFELSWKNFSFLPKDKVRVIFTVTPSETLFLRENVDFIFKNGFKNIDIFPQMFTLWPLVKLKKLEKELGSVIKYLNKDAKHNYNLRILNRLCSSSQYAKLLLGSNGKFYLFEWVQAIPYSQRESYVIGNLKIGIDFKKRLMLFNKLFSKVINVSKGLCLKCDYKNFCALPLPLFLWCYYSKNDFNKYLKNFCYLAKIFINLSKEVKDEIRDRLDTEKLNRFS